jgi:hypothetical protein
MHGSRSKIPSKTLLGQRCAEGFNSGVKGLITECKFKKRVQGIKFISVTSNAQDFEKGKIALLHQK